jgi:hypothetical protein
MRWLVPMLLLSGCAVSPAPDRGGMTASMEQSRYLGEAAAPPRDAPARYEVAQNCGTPEQWKACPRVRRPSVTVFVDVASAGNSATGQQDWVQLRTEPAKP